MTTVPVIPALALCLLAMGPVPGALRAQGAPQQAGVVVRVAERGEAARGVIRDADGALVAGAEIWFDGDSLHRLRSDDRGGFAWPALGPGVHLMAVRAGGYQPLLAPVHVPAGRRLHARILHNRAAPDSLGDPLEVERPLPADTVPRPQPRAGTGPAASFTSIRRP